MCSLNLSHSSTDLNFEICGSILIAPRKNLCAFVCKLCEDVFQYLPQFMRHLYTEHDDEYATYDLVNEHYAIEELLTDGSELVNAKTRKCLQLDNSDHQDHLAEENGDEEEEEDTKDLTKSLNWDPDLLKTLKDFDISLNSFENLEDCFESDDAASPSEPSETESILSLTGTNKNDYLIKTKDTKTIDPFKVQHEDNKQPSSPIKEIKDNQTNSTKTLKINEVEEKPKPNIKLPSGITVNKVKSANSKPLEISSNSNENLPLNVKKEKEIIVARQLQKAEDIRFQTVIRSSNVNDHKTLEMNQHKIGNQITMKKLPKAMTNSNENKAANKDEIPKKGNPLRTATLEKFLSNDPDDIDVLRELINQLESENSNDAQNLSDTLSDIDLMSEVGFKQILEVEPGSVLTVEEKEKAIEMANIIKSEPHLWQKAGNNVKNPEQTNQCFENLTSGINKSFNLKLSLSQTKRIFNLTTLWYHNQKSTSNDEATQFYGSILSFMPKTMRRMFYCEYCEAQLPSQAKYLQHIMQHTGKPPYTCNICFRSFKNKSSLTRHEAIHKK